MRIKNAAVVASGMVLLGTALAGTAQAAPSDDRLEVSLTPVTAGAALAAGELKCPVPPPGNTSVWSRTHSCQTVNATVNVLRNGRPVGSAHFTVQHVMSLDIDKTAWSETVRTTKARLVGNASGIRAVFGTTCGSGCKATPGLKPFTLGSSAPSARTAYQATVKRYTQRDSMSRYTFSLTKPGFTPGSLAYNSSVYRCDDKFYSKKPQFSKPPGCVFRTHPAVETNQRLLPYISKNIRNVQSKGIHIGSPNYGRPLHRITDGKKIAANREAVCPARTKPPTNLPFPKPQCDEYPFASTKEGGTALAKPNRGTMWVPDKENQTQGGFLATFYRENRVLDGDPYYVYVGV
ncbi:NucA/NucB deoxyribonuclease domain-containing protein [Streptomyces sp. HU2014]|uniref:NucA/NucB deoxyribonuclease domain-containing protein n=1 Tax=Streptomyces sp. HU2014 TaxID=2939414 RepID=UPI00200EFB80|nr:NucA/NucB deoxyribonuclease domain-containing protein [Streptomyces sp. HU2014]UQI46193.1 NucA/NucB deoxyribonuclease domain-containing protein [Streptomyces sp. HU2014]